MNPVLKIKRRNKKCGLHFDEKKHKYTIKSGVELESVTTRLEQFFPFDAKQIANKLSEMRGTPARLILKDWKRMRDNGTKVHKLAEKYCNGKKLRRQELEQIKHVTQFLEEHPQFEILGSEIMVFSEKFKIAGTVDLVLRHKDKDKIHILDWKMSNKEIDKDLHWENAKGLLCELPHNKFHQYSMQVAVYMAILKHDYSIEPYDAMVVHLRNDMSYRVIEPTDLTIYAQDVLGATQ